MSDEAAEFTPAIAALLRAAGRPESDPRTRAPIPSAETIVAYCEGDLPEADARQVRLAMYHHGSVMDEVERVQAALAIERPALELVARRVSRITRLVWAEPSDAPVALAAASVARPQTTSESWSGSGGVEATLYESDGRYAIIVERTEAPTGPVSAADVVLELVRLDGALIRYAKGTTDARGHASIGEVGQFTTPGEDQYYRLRVLVPSA